MSMIFALTLAVAAPGLAPAASAPVAPNAVTGVTGVWEGTVGKASVVACFEEDESFHGNGSYYYRKYLVPIGLSQRESGSADWEEIAGEDGIVWTIISQDDDTLTARWSHGKDSVPIRLKRRQWTASGEDFPGPCASPEYVAPRAFTPAVTSKKAEKAGFSYRILTWQPPEHFAGNQIVTFEFDATEPGDAAINRELRAHVPDGSTSDGFMECMIGSLSHLGMDGDTFETYEPTFANRRFLSVDANGSSYCGGAHPAHWALFKVYDRQTGKEIDPAQRWFVETGYAESEYGDIWLMQPALRDIVMAHYPADQEQECREAVGEEEFWNVGMVDGGLGFIPSVAHAMTPCRETVVVGWDEVAPFLSAEGREARASVGG